MECRLNSTWRLVTVNAKGIVGSRTGCSLWRLYKPYMRNRSAYAAVFKFLLNAFAVITVFNGLQ